QHPEKQIAPEEMAFRIQMTTQALQYRGSSLFHGRHYEDTKRQVEALRKSLDYYKRLEKEIPEDEVWKILKQDAIARTDLVPAEYKKPSEILAKQLREAEQGMQYIHEASASADAQAEGIEDTLHHVRPVKDYALDQSMNSYAEAGIHAMQQTENHPKVNRPIFIAPENIFPEMGFGSHPEELMELVTKARERMADLLTTEKIKDPLKRFDKDGQLMDVTNPYYKEGITKEQAKKEAEEHIRATLDTQHLSMWRAHFVPDKGETKQQTDERFKEWYIKQVENLADKKIIGHIHLVDSLGYGHHALPAGSGDLPLKKVIEALKKRGYDGTVVSEGWEEDRFEEGRIMKQAWQTLGSPVYSHFVGRFGPKTWPQMENRWYGATQPPLYIFGAYSPSNDWVLWSEVPFE
ncbi:MAG: TIM barrel protein, partial [Candidatus Woesearchaeota archaeon]